MTSDQVQSSSAARASAVSRSCPHHQWPSCSLRRGRARTNRGIEYENHCIGVFTVRDGKIEHVREYMDTLYASATAFTAAQAG